MPRSLKFTDPATSERSIAHALGWEELDLSHRLISYGDIQLSASRGHVGGRSAVLFARVKARNGADPLLSAALYGYHASVDWGLLADDEGLTVFNPHWLVDGSWYRLGLVPWGKAAERDPVIASMTPAALIDGKTERAAWQRKRPERLLQLVDDELVRRLDVWRDQAVKYARNEDRVDEKLQTLYAQLFVLRTVEDRGLDPQVPPLTSTLTGSQSIDWNAWSHMLQRAREHVGSNLFDEDPAREVPEHVVAGVIDDLYCPRGLPITDARYNFAWLEADVLGAAYEKYLATVLIPAKVAVQADLFLSPEREVERVSVRRQSGVYYTPKYIRDYLATRCVDEFFRCRDQVVPPRVIDFACGSGSFLVAAVDQILRHLRSHNLKRGWLRALVENGYLVGIDIDPKAVTAARLHLWQRLVEEPDALPLPNLSDVIITADGLHQESWEALNKPYDIVLGNPPFLVTGLVPNREELESKFLAARGRYDFSYLFVEQATNVLDEGGLMGMVVPNRLYRNSNGNTIRELLVQRTALLSLVDFGSTKPFDADSYVGCIVARRKSGQEPIAERVRVIEVRSLTPEYLAKLLLDADAAEGEITQPALRAFTARHPRPDQGGRPWTLLSETERRARILIDELSVPLETIAVVPQGIRTGGNDLFVFEVVADDGFQLLQVVNGLDETDVLDAELLEPVVLGSEVKRYQSVIASKKLLYPYRNNVALTESELEERFPAIWTYLLRNRELMAARASLKKAGRKWYELVWPRDESWLRRPKLLIRDLAPRSSFAPDKIGSTFLLGGTAVVPGEPDKLMPLLAYMNSQLVDSLLRRITPIFSGDFQKFEPRHLLSIPILKQVLEDDTFSGRLAELAAMVVATQDAGVEARTFEAEIDELIRQAAGQQGISLED